MHTKKLIALLIISIFFTLNVISADEGVSLDITKAANNVVQNSASIKATDTALNNATIQLNNAKDSPYSYYSNSTYAKILNSEYQLNYGLRGRVVQENAIRLGVYKQFIDILKAKYDTELQKAKLQHIEDLYKTAQVKAKYNQISMKELETSADTYNQEKLQLQIKERDFTSLVTSLNAQMGETPTIRYANIVDDNIIPLEKVSSYDDYLASALLNRAEIQNLKEQLDVKTKEKDLYVEQNSSQYDSYSIQLQYDIDVLKDKLESSSIDVQLDLLSTYDQLTLSMAALDDAHNTLLENEKSYKAAELKYQMGKISLNDKNEEELNYLTSKYDYKKAQLDAWLSQIQMDFAANLGYK